MLTFVIQRLLRDKNNIEIGDVLLLFGSSSCLIQMPGDCVPARSEEGSRKSPFRLANTSTSRGQNISIMPFQNAESHKHIGAKMADAFYHETGRYL